MKRAPILMMSWLLALWAAPERLLAQQPVQRLRESLAQPAAGENGRVARVTLREAPDAAAAVQSVVSKPARVRFTGWRVCIYSDNTAQAREGAREAITTFRESYPGIPLYDSYTSPYFRVSVGNCTTSEEAIMLLERVKPHFPKAFVKQEQLTLSDLLE